MKIKSITSLTVRLLGIQEALTIYYFNIWYLILDLKCKLLNDVQICLLTNTLSVILIQISN